MKKHTLILEIESEHDAVLQIAQCLDEEVKGGYIKSFSLSLSRTENKYAYCEHMRVSKIDNVCLDCSALKKYASK